MAKLRATTQGKGLVQRPAKQTEKYAPEPTAEEYKTFPVGFRLEHGSWPAEEILEARGKRGREEYLIQWKPHPYTLQYFRPTWVGHGEVTADLLASWKNRKQPANTSKPATRAIEDNEPRASTGRPVRSTPGRKRQRSTSFSKDTQAGGSVRRPKRHRSRRIVSDGTSDAEEEAGIQESSNEKSPRSQTTTSTATGSLQSPPPEIEDSQEPVPQPRSTISVIVPVRPSNSSQYIPVSSGFEPDSVGHSTVYPSSSSRIASSSEVPTTFGGHSAGEATADYPTPESEHLHSPAVSDTSFAGFNPETTQSSPLRGSPLVSQISVRDTTTSSVATRETINRSDTRLTRILPSHSIQVRASGIASDLPEDLQRTLLPSAQPDNRLLTSPVNETQISLGGEFLSLGGSAKIRTPTTRQLVQRQFGASQGSSAKTSHLARNPTPSISPFKTQVSPSQSQKQRPFRSLHSDDIESWSREESSRARLQSPFRSSQPQLARLNKRSTSFPLRRPIFGLSTSMAAPSHRSSPRTARASTPSRVSKGMTMTLQEQMAQSRASRQRNAASASPVEGPKAPVVTQIREPIPVQLTTRTSNPTLPKVEISELESSSAMQLDSSEKRSESAHSSSKEAGPAASLAIQQSIEMDEPDKLDSTQESSLLDTNESQENGQVISSSSQGLLPNFPILLPGEFAIPLHAEGRTQDAYREALQAKQKAMSKFLRRGSSSSTPSSNGLVSPKTEANEMAELVGKLDSIVTLMDLGYDGMMTQSSFSGSQLAKYTVKASSKFAFLKALIEALQLYDCSLVIFARAGSTQQVFDHFFSAFDIDFRTYTNSGEAVPGSTLSGKCTVHLVATGQRPNLQLKPGPALIIAFDTSYDPRSEYILNFRGEEGKQIPVLHLLVSNSSEHIERCLPVNMPSPQRNRLLVQSILRGAPHMGRILSGFNDVTIEYYSYLSGGTRIIDDDMMRREQVLQKMPDFHLKRLAQQVGKALIDRDFSADWLTSPPMPPLELDDIPGLVTPQLRLPSPSPVPASPIGTPALRKRLLDGDVLDIPGDSKRQRMTPVPGASPHEHNGASHTHHLQNALKAAKDEAANEKLARMSAEDARDKARSQLNEWRISVSELQKRVEFHRDQDHKARTVVKKVTKDAERITQLRERDAIERETLKTQNEQLREELATARQHLKDAGGDTAALELAQEEARNASASLLKTQKDLANAKQQGEYFRVQYQEAMTVGRSHQNDAEELQSKVKALEIDASDEKRRLKLVNFDDAAQAHMDRIERLELEKRALEAMNRKLNIENASLKANRGVSTRASSVQPPGSPRARSRAGSPIPGLMAAAAAMHAGSRASALRHER